MKKILLLITVLLTQVSNAENVNCETFKSQFTVDQLKVLRHSYAYGIPYNFKYTLPAIAWEESSAGKNLLNYKDPSAGAYQVYAATALSREGLKLNHYNKNNILLELATNEVKSTAHAISELLFWVDNRSNWNDVWASYNGGKNYKEKDASDYAKRIKSKIKKLKQCESVLKIVSFNELDMNVFKEVKRLSKKDPMFDIFESWKKIK